jgi:hypothetical protein
VGRRQTREKPDLSVNIMRRVVECTLCPDEVEILYVFSAILFLRVLFASRTYSYAFIRLILLLHA